jgi:hypothetical protein
VTDLGFVLAAYVVILGVLALYVALLWRRTRLAREASLRIRREAAAAQQRAQAGARGDE